MFDEARLAAGRAEHNHPALGAHLASGLFSPHRLREGGHRLAS
jgi:hypothetical protein